MLDAKNTQFRLSEDGIISFQAQESNPLPGEPIAKLVKGGAALSPVIEITDAKGADAAAIDARLAEWFDAHLKAVLEPLMLLGEHEQDTKDVVKDIAARVYTNMGIVPREELEDLIALLDADDRRDLRAKKIRLGPILVFIPALNKPAAVRLRGLLWSVHNGADIPAKVPNDGLVSCVIDEELVNKDLYQSIGYPVYGGRAIRIDMLDRVICAVYDGADKGKFQAKHEMAEWLGCSIAGLYSVLEAMGHKKDYDPADEVVAEPKAEAAKDAAPVVEAVDEVQASDSEAAAKSDEKPAEVAVVQSDVKPELATFRLKKGKAFNSANTGKGASKPAFKSQDKKPFDKRKDAHKKGKRNKSENRAPKVMSAKAKVDPDDSPFAILQQLKTNNDG